MSYGLLLRYVALAVVAVIVLVVFVIAVRVLTLEAPAPPAQSSKPYYVVKRGDVLSGISQKTGVNLDLLRELNPNLDPLGLVPGQRVRLRASARPPAARKKRRGPLRRFYRVKKGDSLSGISANTDVPLYRLLQLNDGIKPNTLVPGQRIRLRP